MTRAVFALLALSTLPLAAVAQSEPAEGLIPTQTLIRAESKTDVVPTLQSLTLELNNKPAALTALTPIPPSGVQVALLIDDGLSRSAGVQLEDMRNFVSTLPAGTEVLVGYMANGTVRSTPWSTNHDGIAKAIRLPFGTPGLSASPYFCLQEFVKNWPANQEGVRKARFVIMITNGVDPYNGSTSILNQDSPYVATAINDANRAGVAVSSIYYRDAGIQARGGRASFSGQSYLQQVADGTGGHAFFQGLGNPVSMTPFFKEFDHDIAETFIATFPADPKLAGRERLLQMKVKTNIPKLKLEHANQVRPGNQELPTQAQAQTEQP